MKTKSNIAAHRVGGGASGSAALDVCERIMDAIAGHSDWHPSPNVDTPDWNEDAHVRVTLTVGDCRALKAVLLRAKRLHLPNDLALAQQGLGRSVDEEKEGSSHE